MSSPRLAKLSPPRNSDWLASPRLDALIDEATQRGAVWIAAEPGAGKSTLAAAWAAARSARVLWYRADEGDADAAVAFTFLTELARSPRRNARLPIYRATEVEKLETFARNFFRSFFDAIPAGVTLLFDDVHAAAGSDFDVLLAAAVREAPADAPSFRAAALTSTAFTRRIRCSSPWAISSWCQGAATITRCWPRREPQPRAACRSRARSRS